ncbi:hypothetical protein [Sphaerisporangium sp. NPDC051011]|uniref:hypothetical protein n=1 Tax=Sphaerisporangium sp. NPDC051011 TaxID=3155792 RepID=UPI0033E1FC22
MRQPRTTVLGHPKMSTVAHADGDASALQEQVWRQLKETGLSDIPSEAFPFDDPFAGTAALFGVESAPMLGPATRFTLKYNKALEAYLKARRLGLETRPVLPGPLTFLQVLGEGHSGFDALRLLDALLEPYAELLERLATAGAQEVQLDEGALVTRSSPAVLRKMAYAYAWLGTLSHRPRLLVCLCSGEAGPALAVLAESKVESVALDFVTSPGNLRALAGVGGLPRKRVVVGVVDGRNGVPVDRPRALATCAMVLGLVDQLVVAASCPTMRPPPVGVPQPEALCLARQIAEHVVNLGNALGASTDVGPPQ